MRNKGILRLMAALMAVVLCAAAFSVTAFAYGGDTAVAETTGGLKLDTEENEPDDEAEAGMDTAALTGEDIAELLSSLFGSQVGITVTDDGIQIAADTHGLILRIQKLDGINDITGHFLVSAVLIEQRLISIPVSLIQNIEDLFLTESPVV